MSCELEPRSKKRGAGTAFASGACFARSSTMVARRAATVCRSSLTLSGARLATRARAAMCGCVGKQHPRTNQRQVG